MNSIARRFIPITLIVALALTMIPISEKALAAEEKPDTVDTAKINKIAASSKNGFKKIDGQWYYIKKHKVVKGFKKIKKDYYFFDKYGTMQSGLIKHKKASYYFNKTKNGKAPALKNSVKEIDEKIFYFKSNGKRYNFGFKDTGSKKSNIAAGIIISSAKVTKKQSKRKRLDKAYRKILKRTKYRHGKAPNLKNKKWYRSFAYNAVMKKKCQCYGFAAMSGVVAKALGYDAAVQYGGVTFSGLMAYSKHAWAYVKIDGDKHMLDASGDRAHRNGELVYYMKKLEKHDGYTGLDGRPSKYKVKYTYAVK